MEMRKRQPSARRESDHFSQPPFPLRQPGWWCLPWFKIRTFFLSSFFLSPFGSHHRTVPVLCSVFLVVTVQLWIVTKKLLWKNDYQRVIFCALYSKGKTHFRKACAVLSANPNCGWSSRLRKGSLDSITTFARKQLFYFSLHRHPSRTSLLPIFLH